jgi:hypothetical protein
VRARGVTRPMSLRQSDDHLSGDGEDRSGLGGSGEDGSDGDDSDDHEGPPRREVLEVHHSQTLWVPWTLILLGAWTMLAPATFGYLNEASWTRPSGGRGAWFSDTTHDELRAWLMVWSDLVAGALLVVLGWRALKPNRPVAWWGACFIGIWLVLAPVLFWSPTAAGYYQDSTVGILVIALAILIPGMPNMAMYMQMGPPRPPGWSYNPSSWSQRSILIALGFAGLVVSRYLGAFQLGYIKTVWDPFFGFESGTMPVLNSNMSHMWPISDAALGAVAYSFEFLMGYMGGPSRWRTMPWMVTIFGILVIPLGLSHIALVMSQPIVVHEWCTLCLVAAAVMLPMIPLEVDEVVAMAQHVRDSKRRGDRDGSLWKIFWLGGSGEDSQPDERTPAFAEFAERPGAVARASVWGFGTPWNLVASALVGVWLLAAPAVFDVPITSGAADVAHLVGAAVVVVAVVSMGEVVRALRFLDVASGLAVGVLVWWTPAPTSFRLAMSVTGLAVVVLAPRRGRVTERYGNWDRMIV